MAELNRPHPPGKYPVVVVGSGPGGLQFSYCLARLGVKHAVISEDAAPGGMFRRFPVFQRLVTWTKPYAPAEAGTRPYQWFDWNSLIAEDEKHRALVRDFMDGSSYFPSRSEMESAIGAFADRAGIEVRYGCTWQSTARSDDGFELTTSDGVYECDVAVFAVGVSRPYKPTDIPGLDVVPHYMDVKTADDYRDKRVFIIGKQNSGFEIGDGLLPQVRTMYLASPRPARLSVFTHSTAAARARYVQPYEDHLLGGGTFVLDAAIERVEKTSTGYRVFAEGTTQPGPLVLEVDEVIAATGVRAPMRDLPDLGVKTFYRGGVIPALTPYWESVSVPGIYFTGGASMGAVGLKKYGIPSNSAAVHGFRYNAVALAQHLASTRFGVKLDRPEIAPKEVVPYLLSEATRAPELWNQQSYLARILSFYEDGRVTNEGIQPLHHFVDASGADSVAVAVETTDTGEIRPALYVRRDGRVDDFTLDGNSLLDFETPDHRAQTKGAIKDLISTA